MENSFCRIGHTPHHSDPNFHRITEAIIDLLTVIVECHDLQGNLLFGTDAFAEAFAPVAATSTDFCTVSAIHIPALVQFGLAAGFTLLQNGFHPVKSCIFQSADILTEQSKHQSFLRFQNFKSQKRDPADGNPDDRQ